ncbi:MAG: 2-succinyl-5-enolpyruvyl-6-hydroxy-3-cyclohexene-1-carboxylic-acid synthase [Bacteroidia bacterium]|nr:2-succinyl-5-enolpyruvyl-6-hydroxy-3-cyclohexene-1-carboxylic-acid synthase [Bacteroidia bacterium]NNF31064.1 2-succinyl-5-enolpyruvyl-6-hydroxy-3-cyclohexene-1-carboxylic-acid synthase [Flavobacteriaceae bacterium]
MNFSSKRLSQTITQLCLVKEIDHVVISPGSRNAPLTIGFTEHPFFKTFSIVDERSAAFFALGIAQQIKKPVALVCTSGSAMLNYYPAVAEAFYSDIPLVVISADRPEYLIEVGDGQTIKQENVFANHILYSANCKEGDEFQIHNETEVNIALNTSLELRGPVHINAPFDEPLYERRNDLQVRPQHVPIRIIEESIPDFEELQSLWNTSGKKMILVGAMSPGSLNSKIAERLASDGEVLVLTETTSNVRHPNFVPAIDQLISALENKEFEELRPDLLITFGGMIISKRIKAFLRKYPPRHHWHVDTKKAYDTFFILSQHVKMSPNRFFKNLLKEIEPSKPAYRDTWLAIKNHRLKKHAEYLEVIPYSDFKVYYNLFASIPKNYQVQIANSAAVRYAQLFDLDESLKVFCNRGTSGIDGSTSTAIGAALGSNTRTVLVTGDLSFFYDSNALWNAYIPKDFRIIIINNAGGGIFRILPGAKETDHFKTYFETTHGLNAKNLSEMFGIGYLAASDEKQLMECLEDFYSESDVPRILEVFTPAELNDKILVDYFEFIR